MRLTCSPLLCLSLASFSFANSAIEDPRLPRSVDDVICIEIAEAISSASAVFFPGDSLYEKGVFHYATSSTQQPKCVVEAGTPADIGKILNVISKSRTPFAVKGGGHILNPGFSSTTGVHISMYRFSEIKYSAETQTADIGAGLIWDDVYAALEPFGVNVIGGRVTGIGVAGFTLGGGYSWKSNQFGLAVDNVVAFELVKPNGQVVNVTHTSDPGLFFGLKGGQNNFGIVTKFTVKAFPQTSVWGGSIVNSASDLPAVAAATVAFQATVTDPKAAIIISYAFSPQIQQVVAAQQLFYDAPTPPPGIFEAFLAVPSISSDISTRSFLSLVQSSPINNTAGERGTYEGLPMIRLTPAISDAILNETTFWGTALANKSELGVAYSMELFLPSLYSHNSERTAYPPVRTIPFQPFNINYFWNSSAFDAEFRSAAISSSAHVRNAAIAMGQSQLKNAPNYPNYAALGTPLVDMYGENLSALRALKARVDPENVMGLAGGWKF